MLKAVCDISSVPVIASGGAGCKEDFVTLFKTLPKIDAGPVSYTHLETIVNKIGKVIKEV